MNTPIASSKTKSIYFWDKLNVLRAGILGANDGIISVSGIVLGATGANLSSTTLLVSGISGMLAGACSMAGGEWISVSAQHDVQEYTMAHENPQVDVDLSQKDLLVPFHAAAMSFTAFIIGSLIPLLAIMLSAPSWRFINTAIAMVIALSLNAIISTYETTNSTKRTIIRNVVIGILTIFITYGIGALLHMMIG
ncbi:VIT1/CCC1 transporter family protein [Levilactobacillus andaensis]|uniref:VIT1/CCC1 transporter family protein n=1 Tax=Levilactobacillus andaensis TaxID=2799570 RepID=UPI0019432A5A|nr:VIT1/CCC1 transporter family protein [Levilactobacillus andaensis]